MKLKSKWDRCGMNKCKLGDLFYIKQGYAFQSQKYVSQSQYILCTLGNFSNSNNFKFNEEKATYYPDDFSHEFILQENDLIIPLTEQVVGLFGNTAFVPRTEGFQFVLNQRVGKIVPYDGKADKVFLHYLLSTQSVRDQIEATASGTKQRNTSPDKIYDVTVWVPDIDEQRSIGECLYRLEQKCNINAQICSELETMAKTLYDYWFVQFDFPDENGKPYRTSGGEMVWNEQLKREVPKGWGVTTVGKTLAKIPNTPRVLTNEYQKEGIIPIIDQSSEFIAGYTDSQETALTSESGYIVFGDHTRIVKYVRFPFARGADGTQVLKSSDDCIPDELFYQMIQSIDLSNYGYARHFKFLKDTMIIRPEQPVANKFSAIVKPVYEKQVKLIFENIELSKLRDWLLPMLMNGQARVE